MRSLARRVSDGKMLHLVRMWLKSPVEETDERGRKRLTGGKRSKRGMPQGGVISPLLANIYMHRYIKAFKGYGLEKKYGARLVVYADDFVVLCRRGAGEVLEITRRWMERMSLCLNPGKTAVRNAAEEHFDFLGYTFGPLYWPVNGARYLGAAPSRKDGRRIRQHVRGLLRPGNMDAWKEVVSRLNRMLRGRANYYSYGTQAKVRYNVDSYVYGRVRHFLRRRSKHDTRGTRRFPAERVFGELGVNEDSSS